MVTRFQSKTLPVYHAPQYQSPLASIWSAIAAWYSTSPEFRQKFAEIFASDGTPTEEQLAEASEVGTTGMEGYRPSQVLSEDGTSLVTNPEFATGETGRRDTIGQDESEQALLNWEEMNANRVADRQNKLLSRIPQLASASWLDDADDFENSIRSGYNPNLRGGHR